MSECNIFCFTQDVNILDSHDVDLFILQLGYFFNKWVEINCCVIMTVL